jgi:hypothetical protein
MFLVFWFWGGGKVAKKAVGYTISKADLGRFVIKEIGKDRRTGQVMSITHF